MNRPPFPLPEDATRLAALHSYAILDSAPEPGFDDLAHLAAQACDVPVALVSLVGRDRQWFKAQVNFPSCETDLTRSVCKFVLAEPDILQIPDLTADPRTAHNPLVTGAPHIRFYAGAPLRTAEGHVLGSLCVIDKRPRPEGLTARQADALRRLARQVMALLELRRAVEERDSVLGRQNLQLRRERHLNVLAQASAALLTASDPGRVLEPILATSAKDLGFEQCYIYDVDPDGLHLRLTQSIGTTETVRAALAHVDVDGPLCGIVARTGRPLVLADVLGTSEPRYALARTTGINAFAGYPVTSRGRTVSVISFTATAQGTFDEGALSFFATLARYVSAVRERLDGEAALRASDARSRLAQEAGQVGTFEVDVASGMMQVSGEFCRLYGVPASPLYSTLTFENLVLPEDAGLRSSEATREAGSAALDVEYRIRRADTRAVRWIARHARFVRDASGRVVSMFGAIRDITEQREAQEALRASEERFRTLLDTMETAFAIVEVKFDADDRPVDHRFVEANPAFARQAGVNLRGKWVTEFAPDLERFWFETYGHVAKTGEPASFESYAEAFKRWFDVRAVRVGDPAERRIAILFNDVTARRRAEEDLRASEALARENVERVQLALAAGAIIGTWHWDLPSDRFTVDEAFAHSSGLDPALGREGIPLARIVATVHPDDQAGLAAAINEAIARGGAYAHQYRVRRADGRYYWIEANGRVDHAPDGTPKSFPGVLLDVEERRAAEVRRNALLALGDRLRDLTSVGAMTLAACEVLGTALGVELVGYGDVDARLETITVARDWTTGGAETRAGTLNFRDFGSYIEDLTRNETVTVTDCRDDPRTRAHADALEARSARAFVNVPVFERGTFLALLYVSTVRARTWTAAELAFIREVASRLRLAVARVEADQQRALLNHELSHRMKNLLAMVQAIATQTLRNTSDPDAARDALAARLVALGKAHDILMSGRGQSAEMQTVVAEALKLHDDGHPNRFRIGGPAVTCGSKAALSLALMLHELATNAAKYGALRVPGGTVSITWRLDGDPGRETLSLVWQEQGGPSVTAPARKGFGSRLIERGLAGSVGGTVTTTYAPAGVTCTLVAPLAGFADAS